ncbi:MAG: DUF3179 domain-containing protein [Flavobacteriales bacterium]|nr:DUF3179 domain-containing protein [Flavobacteriales bacterium]
MRALLFLLGVLLLIIPEILRVYYIMPFPGSQENVATDLRQVNIAYWLHGNIWWVRLIGLALVAGPAWHYLRHGGWWKRLAVVLPLALAALVYYAFTFRFMADKMFLPPTVKQLATPAVTDSTANSLVVVVVREGEARAYPIELIGYHHQVVDTIGGEAVMITYCTVCRTGRAFKPQVNGQPERFRLVGMDHFNAMFEDGRTGSWWRQVSGECIAGPLKGQHLEEVPSTQLTLAEFARLHPQGLVFMPDPNFTKRYADLKGFDDGTIDSHLEYRDTASWQPKSWVVGVVHNGVARAYDWNDLTRDTLIGDTLGGDSVLLTYGPSPISFAVYRISLLETIEDNSSGDVQRLFEQSTLPAYQEFWHSWRTFHPNTTRYLPEQ